MKKYLIRLDLEGVSGIISYEQATPGNADYAEGRRLFMGDLLAAIDGLFEGGADEIYLYDEHCSARNVFIDELPENVYYYSGKPPYSEEWRGGLDASFEGMIMLGFPSKAGSNGCLLNHSYDLNISNIDVNGISLGEIGMETAIAGEAGVPLLMVTADSEGVREARELVPEVIGVSVKESLSEYSAMCYPAKVTQRWIREGAKKAAQLEKKPDLYVIDGPITLKVDFFPGKVGEAFAQQVGPAVYEGKNVTECWVRFQEDRQALKLD